MSRSATWTMPTTIRFGPGRLDELAQACVGTGITRPCVITDHGLKDHEIVRQVLDHLDGHRLPARLFADMRPDPTDRDLALALAAFHDGGHDGVVAVGGGSAIDLGKLVAFMVGQSRPVWDFVDGSVAWASDPIGPGVPVIAIPTTAGTGSEVGRASVLVDPTRGEKRVIFHPRLLPDQVISDPLLTVGLPRHLTSGTGMDAFAHCLEAYCSPSFHPMCDGIALEGMRLVLEYLPRAFADGADLEARGAMMSAATMGAVAFQKGLGAVHALSHPIGAIARLHHGTTNAVLIPAVLRFNRLEISDAIERAGTVLQVPGGFDGFVFHVEELLASFALDRGLSGLGLDRDSFEVIAAQAVRDPSASTNPRPLDVNGALSILEDAF